MAVKAQDVTDRYAIYCADSMEVMGNLPDDTIHLSIYSPPFAGLYHYSSSEADLSNAADYNEFLIQYSFFIRELHRIAIPGRVSVVHCADIPTGNSGTNDALIDLPGDIIRLHRDAGFDFVARRHVWKEPLGVRNRTLAKGLAHRTIVEDSAQCSVASADYILTFRKRGDNPLPIKHPAGLDEYAGAHEIPYELRRFKGHTGKQTENRYSHWIWRQYASSCWGDVRIDRVLPFRDARDDEDEKHVHPLQLDVIERALHLWSLPGEKVFTPFMGVGSEVYAAVRLGRFGIGAELKPSYYAQSVKNLAVIAADGQEPVSLFEDALS